METNLNAPSPAAPAPWDWLRLAAWIAVAGWAICITILSSMTPQQLQTIAPFEFWDKMEHFAAFAVGSGVLAIALRRQTGWSWRRIVIFSAIAISLFGMADETHQLFTPGRSGADPYDWTADTLGGIFGALATRFIHGRTNRPHRTAPPGA